MNFFQVVQKATQACATCGRFGEDLLMCPCRQVFYCSTACQERDWSNHCGRCGAGRKGQRALRACANCSVTSYTLKSCVCGAVLYCDTVCQRQHWATHRRTCTAWIAAFQRSKVRYRDASSQTTNSATLGPQSRSDAVVVYVEEPRDDGARVISRKGRLLMPAGDLRGPAEVINVRPDASWRGASEKAALEAREGEEREHIRQTEFETLSYMKNMFDGPLTALQLREVFAAEAQLRLGIVTEEKETYLRFARVFRQM